jgi:sucrose-6-phosphate hydrolase SacC (GH32 family)
MRECRLHVFFDGSVLEIFADAGRSVLATRIYPEDAGGTSVALSCTGGGAVVRALDLWSLTPVWK